MANSLNGHLAAQGPSKDLTLTVVGCGTLGTSILTGILSTISQSPSASGTSTPADDRPTHIPSRFIACVTSTSSAKRIQGALSPLTDNLTVLTNENLHGVQEADVMLLGCKPQMAKEILSEPGIQKALAGKFLISILAGVPVSQLEQILYGYGTNDCPVEERCRIVRVMPNTASRINESMTVIATSTPPLPAHLSALTTWMFSRIGRVIHLKPALMDVSTALCGSGPAFFSLFMEALTDGAVAMGIPVADARLMAAQTMKGTAGLVLAGEHPAVLREKVSTPGGCTIGGLLVLEEGTVRGTAARCLRETTEVASDLGKGVQGVNGTRFTRR
ncbi:delta 1-pyrroline-5-carboxylate reductase [Trapelia coarctata]|nr:delta 1-pyrroline-5-carboxylate reductase [Trapelia coarctata]